MWEKVVREYNTKLEREISEKTREREYVLKNKTKMKSTFFKFLLVF